MLDGIVNLGSHFAKALGWMSSFFVMLAATLGAFAAVFLPAMFGVLKVMLVSMATGAADFGEQYFGDSLDGQTASLTDAAQAIADTVAFLNSLIAVDTCVGIIFAGISLKLTIRLARWALSLIPFVNAG